VLLSIAPCQLWTEHGDHQMWNSSDHQDLFDIHKSGSWSMSILFSFAFKTDFRWISCSEPISFIQRIRRITQLFNFKYITSCFLVGHVVHLGMNCFLINSYGSDDHKILLTQLMFLSKNEFYYKENDYI